MHSLIENWRSFVSEVFIEVTGAFPQEGDRTFIIEVNGRRVKKGLLVE